MRYFIWVLGCAMNNSDAERIAAVLELLGYRKTGQESEADLIITVACSVRQHAIDRIYGSIEKWQDLKSKNPRLKTVLTGCVLAEDRAKMTKFFDVIFEIEDLAKLPGLLGEVLSPGKLGHLGKSGEYLGIMPAYESNFRAFVPIMTGCNNFCSYCAVPLTRGREKSRSMLEIITEVQGLVEKGFKEITLLGQNVNSYGGNLNTKPTFANLLKKLDLIEGDWRGYFYSNHPKDISDELIETIAGLKHFPAYIHLPLQSGSDRIIKAMNRRYTRDGYLALVAKIRKKLPEMTLTTDIIVGYPGETAEDFAETVKVMEGARFDMAFLAQYSPRPGTISAKLPDSVSSAEKVQREKILTRILAETARENSQSLLGTVQRVLIDGQKGRQFYGRSAGYKVVEIKTDRALRLGQFYNVTIESAGAWKLAGVLGANQT